MFCKTATASFQRICSLNHNQHVHRKFHISASCNGYLDLLKVWSGLEKVDEKSTRHGGEVVAEVLKSHGVKHIFTLAGGHISPILVGAEKLGIRIIDTRHEVTTVFAADAVARLSGTIGVAAVTAGPGVTNTITAAKNAQMAESPVLLIGGAASTLTKNRGALQDIEQIGLFKSICKHSTSITTVRDIVPMMKKAIQIAQSGTPGPVFIEFPLDVLYDYSSVKNEVVTKSSGKSFFAKLVQKYLQLYVDNIFAGAFEKRDLKPLPLDIPMPSASQIDSCASLLRNAKRPLLLMGSQSTLPPVDAERIRKAVEDLGIPCFLGGMSRGLLGKQGRLHMRQQRRDALKEADVVILAGTVCDFRLSYGRVLSPKSKIIAVNRSKQQLYKNSDAFWKPTIPLQCDVGTFLVDLAEKLGKSGFECPKEWIDTLRERDNKKESANAQMADAPAETHLNPLKVLYDFDSVQDDNTILVADGGDFVSTAAYTVRPRGPLKWLDPGAFGTLGVGAGFALGVKLVRPECDVAIIFGDGALGYSLIEFDTFMRHKIPLVALIGNDACWTQIIREQVKMLKSDVACNLAFSEYHKAVEGLGCKGVLVTANDKDRLKEIFTKARDDSRKGDIVLLNTLIGKTTFREGSLSV